MPNNRVGPNKTCRQGLFFVYYVNISCKMASFSFMLVKKKGRKEKKTNKFLLHDYSGPKNIQFTFILRKFKYYIVCF